MASTQEYLEFILGQLLELDDCKAGKSSSFLYADSIA